MKLSFFTDVGYADICNDRSSISGVAVMLRGTAVYQLHNVTLRDTVYERVAEYVAISHRAKTALAMKAVLDFVHHICSVAGPL